MKNISNKIWSLFGSQEPTPPSILPFARKILGLNAPSLNDLSSASHSGLRNISVIVTFVAAVSATIFGATISMVTFGNFQLALYIFPVWFVLILLVDRTVVLSSENDKFIKTYRYILTIVLVVLHGGLADAYLFQKDIERYDKEIYATQIKNVSQPYLDQIKSLENSILSNENTDHELLIDDKTFADSLGAEQAGTNSRHKSGKGIIYNAMEEIQPKRQAMNDSLRQSNMLQNQRLKTQIDTLNAQKNQAISQIPKPQESGLIDKMNSLHEVLTSKSGYYHWLFYYAVFLLVGIVEIAPIFAKKVWRYSLTEYQDVQLNQHGRANKKSALQYQADITLDAQIINAELIERTANVIKEFAIKSLKRSIGYHKERCKTIEAFIKEMDKLDKTYRNQFPDLFNELFAPEFKRASEDFKAQL